MTRAWIVALTIAGSWLVDAWLLDARAGWIVTRTPAAVEWRGAWDVPADGLYDLALESDGQARWTIDQHPVVQASTGVGRRTVWLDAGFHSVDISAPGAPSRITVSAAKSGEALEPLQDLRAAMPRHPRRRAFGQALGTVLGWSALLSLIWAIRTTAARQRDRLRRWRDVVVSSRWRPILGRAVAWAALTLILAHAALLRVDAITGRQGVVTSPRWLAGIQTREHARPEAIAPASFAWPREELHPHRDGPPTYYVGDPYIYLDDARHMASFYAAHFREPVFPFVTRLFLKLLDGQDVAVSFASACSSVLAIWLTYALGAAVWSRPVGLLAALGLSLDADVVSLASLGWRDDTYMAMVVLCAYLMLRLHRVDPKTSGLRHLGRLRLEGGYREAVALGIVSGLAILTRVMAASFLVAGFACLLVSIRGSWRRRLTLIGLALVAGAIVASPYFINCWRVYGDPLYTFNVHGSIYASAEGTAWTGNTAGYVLQKLASRPVEIIDTLAQGMTTYPFTNKWRGLDAWCAGAGDWAAVASLVGLVVLAAFSRGRLLVIATAGALVPFSFTWKVDPHFRFTEFAYPLLLIAAAVAVDVAARSAWFVVAPPRDGERAIRRPDSWLAWAGVVGVGVAGLWFVTRVAPSWVFRETLRAGETAMVTAGVRDGAFFDKGWSKAIPGEVVSLRVVTEAGSMAMPLAGANDYTVLMRLDPFPRPIGRAPERLPVVDVALNGAPVGEVTVQWNPDRVGSYAVALPRALVRHGVNRLEFRVRRPVSGPVEAGLTDGDAIALWYVRVQPAAR